MPAIRIIEEKPVNVWQSIMMVKNFRAGNGFSRWQRWYDEGRIRQEFGQCGRPLAMVVLFQVLSFFLNSLSMQTRVS